MLYVTTRSKQDVYTAQRALTQRRASDGGFYIPFREPQFTREQIQALGSQSFQESTAQILNLLFGTKLTPWDVEFSVGRRPVRLEKIGRRVLAGERWHNCAGQFRQTVQDLTGRIRSEKGESLGAWAEIGVGIATLFGMFSGHQELLDGDAVMDVAAASGDLFSVVSAWYARSWGLPIGTIVICCNDNGGLWELLHSGTLRTDGISRETSTPEADTVLPEGLEILLCACGGQQESLRYLEAVRVGAAYTPSEWVLSQLRQGLFVSVIGERRVEQTISSVYSSHHYLMSPYTALGYAGLSDHRTRTGDSGWGLILADRSPALDGEIVARALGISRETLKEYLNQE